MVHHYAYPKSECSREGKGWNDFGGNKALIRYTLALKHTDCLSVFFQGPRELHRKEEREKERRGYVCHPDVVPPRRPRCRAHFIEGPPRRLQARTTPRSNEQTQ